MYLHLGKGTVVPKRNIIGIFDLDITSQSHLTRKFLSRADRAGEVPGIASVLTVNPYEKHETAGIPFETVPAYNHLPKLFHPKKNRWVGYVIVLEGIRVWIAGDTDATPEAAAVGCDIALGPVGECVSLIRYSRAVPGDTDTGLVRDTSILLKGELSRPARLRYLLRRFFIPLRKRDSL